MPNAFAGGNEQVPGMSYYSTLPLTSYLRRPLRAWRCLSRRHAPILIGQLRKHGPQTSLGPRGIRV